MIITNLQFQDYSQQFYDPSTYWQNYSQAWTGYYGSDQMNTSMDSTQMMNSTMDTSMQQMEVIEDDFALVGECRFNLVYVLFIWCLTMILLFQNTKYHWTWSK